MNDQRPTRESMSFEEVMISNMWEIARDCGSARTKGPVHEARSLS